MPGPHDVFAAALGEFDDGGTRREVDALTFGDGIEDDGRTAVPN
jgi:hypothetical protein